MSVVSYLTTIRDCAANPARFFCELRPLGWQWAPVLYAAATIALVRIVGTIIQLGWIAVQLEPATSAPTLLRLAPVAIGSVLLGPIVGVIGLFIYAGFFHAGLVIVRGESLEFETTFRVVAYAVGSVGIVSLIPLCGPYLFALAFLPYVGMGLAYTHEISAGAATLVVVGTSVLFVLTCGGLILLLGELVA